MNEKGPNGIDKLLEELGEIFSGSGEVVEAIEQSGGVFLKDHINQGGNGLARSETEDVLHVVFLDMLATEGDELIQHGLGIAHSAIGSLGNGPGSRFIEIDTFLGSNVKQLLGNDVGGDGPEIKALAAGNDGGEDLVRFGGREDELHVLGRLFKSL